MKKLIFVVVFLLLCCNSHAQQFSISPLFLTEKIIDSPDEFSRNIFGWEMRGFCIRDNVTADYRIRLWDDAVQWQSIQLGYALNPQLRPFVTTKFYNNQWLMGGGGRIISRLGPNAFFDIEGTVYNRGDSFDVKVGLDKSPVYFTVGYSYMSFDKGSRKKTWSGPGIEFGLMF